MGSRERKREERRKRKRRSQESFQERMDQRTARSEERNEAVRRQLEPLARGERPAAVTVATVVSALFSLVFTVSAVLAAAGVEISNGSAPRAIPIAIFAGVLWLMTWGLWRARYWAVLGFQMLLLLVLLASALGLVQVATLPQAIGTVLLLAGSGTLFYFMIRAMARIQMPQRPVDDGPGP
jgi:hypothetical protein